MGKFLNGRDFLMEENEENYVKELRVKTLHKERMGFIRAGLSTGLVKTDSFRHTFATQKCAVEYFTRERNRRKALKTGGLG